MSQRRTCKECGTVYVIHRHATAEERDVHKNLCEDCAEAEKEEEILNAEDIETINI